MKFNLPKPTPSPELDSSLRIGNVYRCKDGGKTHYLIVIGISERTVNLLGINSDGVVTSTANYGAHLFEGGTGFTGRDLLGICPGIENIDLDVTWIADESEQQTTKIKQLLTQLALARDALQKTMGAWGGTCAWHADVKAAIVGIDAAMKEKP